MAELAAMVGINQGYGPGFQQISVFWRLVISNRCFCQQTDKATSNDKEFSLVKESVCSDLTPAMCVSPCITTNNSGYTVLIAKK